MRVDQFLPDFASQDAIGKHVLNVRRVLREAGWESDVWATLVHDEVADDAHPWLDYDAQHREEGVLLYHHSTESGMVGWLQQRTQSGSRLGSVYHNITPAPYFARWEPLVAAQMGRARSELSELAPFVELAIGDSSFNRAELEEAGYAKSVVSPLLVDLDAFHAEADTRALGRLRRRAAGGAHWIFVGRVAPNKCQHDVMAAFAVYRRLYDPDAVLSIIGGASAERYLRALHRLATRLGLGDSVELAGSVTDAELLAYYHSADVFVCLSEHEGYCVPVLESMELGVPVVAFEAAAVPETAGSGALLMESKDPLGVAWEVAGLLSDDRAREAQVAAGRARAEELSLPQTSQRLLDNLTSWLGHP